MDEPKGLHHISVNYDRKKDMFSLYFYLDNQVFTMNCVKGVDKEGFLQLIDKLRDVVYGQPKP